jgi:hypothetical protein
VGFKRATLPTYPTSGNLDHVHSLFANRIRRIGSEFKAKNSIVSYSASEEARDYTPRVQGVLRGHLCP